MLIGVDFSSRPSARKAIVLAIGARAQRDVVLQEWLRLDSIDAFAAWLRRPQRWLGGFDFPFGLPRELVQQFGWPLHWRDCLRHYAGFSRAEIRSRFSAFCAARPAGSKFAHRACDRPAGSSPSMKWVNPPVAYMLHAAVPVLLNCGLDLPAHRVAAAGERIALEAYPGLLAREIIGARSYKSDTRAKQTAPRAAARAAIVDALTQARTRLGLRLQLSTPQRDALVADASGDTLDAVLCLMQAAWAQGQANWGLPESVDPLEGWIVSA